MCGVLVFKIFFGRVIVSKNVKYFVGFIVCLCVGWCMYILVKDVEKEIFCLVEMGDFFLFFMMGVMGMFG